MGIYESLRGFEASLPRMCLYCRGGWLAFAPVWDGTPAVFCASAHHTTHPRTKKGAKLPKADYMPLMGPGDLCERFAPIRINDTKAVLLDLMGFFDEVGIRPLPRAEGGE